MSVIELNANTHPSIISSVMHYMKSNIKHIKIIIGIIFLVLISGCNTNPATQGYYPFTVDKLIENIE